MAAPTPAAGPVSPRLSALRHELDTGAAGALHRFWSETDAAGTPLVEPVEGDASQVLVTLLWRGGDELRNVVAETPFDAGDPADCQMTHVPGSDVWYRTFRAPSDLRFSYRLSPNDPLTPWRQPVPWAQRVATWRADPLNRGRRLVFPADAEAPAGDARGAAWEHSTVELPAARRDRWSAPGPDVPAGQVEVHRLPSEGLLPCDWLDPPRRDARRVWVYTPPGYAAAGGPYPWLLLFDGYDYLHYVRVPAILDRLRAAGRVPPLVAVLLDTPNRLRGTELNGSERFADALAADLVPWLRRRYAVAAEPERGIVGGFSLGGLGAAFAAFRHPGVFGTVLAQSGAFWPAPGGVTRRAAQVTLTWASGPPRAGRGARYAVDRGRRDMEVLQELSMPRVVAAKEACDELFAAGLGATPGAELHDEPGLLWYVTGVASPSFNGVSRTRLSAAGAEAAIPAVLAHFRRRGTPMTWRVTPSSRPRDLGRRLEAQGLRHAADPPQMALDLRAPAAALPAPPGLAIRAVGEGEDIRTWIDVFSAGARPEIVAACHAAYPDLSARLPFRHFLGRLDGAPVAVASVLLAAGIGVVHHVTTLPAARRRGIGSAMTLAAADAARAAGYRIAALGSSPMAVGVYHRLGFREQCRFALYEWRP